MSDKSPRLPTDEAGRPIQTLAFETSVNITVISSSARVALQSNATVLLITVTQATWVNFGDVTVDATADSTTSFLIPSGGVTMGVPDGATYIAAVRDSADGKLCAAKLS